MAPINYVVFQLTKLLQRGVCLERKLNYSSALICQGSKPQRRSHGDGQSNLCHLVDAAMQWGVSRVISELFDFLE